MKIILSKKGFDFSNGGIPSPIFEDETMVSFPIPSDDEYTYGDFAYGLQEFRLGYVYGTDIEKITETLYDEGNKIRYSG